MAEQSCTAFINWLTDRHAEITACESQALDQLKSGDKDAYKDKMIERTNLIKDLESGIQPFQTQIPADVWENAQTEIKRFATSASAALNLDSVFYMSALLYRDAHKDGEPDNLLVLIENLKK